MSARGPYWQFFESTYYNNDHSYKIVTPSWESDITSVDDSGILPFQENAVRFARIRLPNGAIRQIVFWFAPILLDTGVKDRVPVIDFNFKAWLPRPTRRIHAPYTNHITQTLDALQTRYSSISSSVSYIATDDEPLSEVPVRPPTPPRQRSRSSTPPQTDSDDETQSIMTVYPSFNEPWVGSPRRLEFPPLPPSPPASEARMPLPIPEHVGTLLIADARKSNDSCPISAIPYSEITQLAVTSCFHIFDCQSLNHWRQEHSSCPVCRTTIANVVTK